MAKAPVKPSKDSPAAGAEAAADSSMTHSVPAGTNADDAAALKSAAAGAGADAPATDASGAKRPEGAADADAAAPAAAPRESSVDLVPPLPPLPDRIAAQASLVVKSKPERRRRAGRTFTRQETVIPLAALSPEARAAIEGDSELAVTVRVAAPHD